MSSFARAARRRKEREAKFKPVTYETYIDLIDYIKLRTRCTTSTAKAVLLAGALKVDSHPVGYKWEKNRKGELIKVLDPLLPAKHRSSLVVTPVDIEKLLNA